MPKVKQIEKCKHPNSRKTKALVKQLKKQNTRGKSKLSTNIKQNLLGEKFLWFRDNLDTEQNNCSAEDVENLILKYLGRFDDELEQIRLKHTIGQRKNRQHASREDIINMTLKREREEFKTAGIEMPDLLNTAQLNLLKNWAGELRFLQNFKLRRFSIANLQAEINKILTDTDKKQKHNENKLEETNKNKDDNQQQVNNITTKTTEEQNILEQESNRESKDSSRLESMDVDK